MQSLVLQDLALLDSKLVYPLTDINGFQSFKGLGSSLGPFSGSHVSLQEGMVDL